MVLQTTHKAINCKGTALGLNTGKYGPEKTPYLDTFYELEALNGVLLRIWS